MNTHTLDRVRAFGLRLQIALIGLVFLACSAVAAQAKDKWLRLSSEHFDMLSCTSESASKEMLVKLEQFRAAFFGFFPEGRAYDPRPLIVVFDDDSQFKPYKPLFNGKPKDVAGYFLPRPLGPRIAIVNEEQVQGLPTIYHEYVHALLSARGWNPPLWVNEGLAETYSTCQINGDIVVLGRAIPWHVRALRSTKLIPLGTFFAVDYKSPFYNESKKASIFYAQSWAFMNYLLFGLKSDGGIVASFDKFMVLSEDKQITVSEAFRQSFGMEYKEMEKALTRYVDAGSILKIKKRVSAKPIRDAITCRPATDFERDMELLDLRWKVNQVGDTALRALEMTGKYPESPRPYELLAEISMSESDIRQAEAHLRQAVARNSGNPLVYIWLLRYNMSAIYTSLDYRFPDELCAELRGMVDKALELAPNNMETIELLAMIECRSEKMRAPAVKQVRAAVDSMREKHSTLLSLAIIYWRIKDYKSAVTIIMLLLDSPKTPATISNQARALGRIIVKETGQELPVEPQPSAAEPDAQPVMEMP